MRYASDACHQRVSDVQLCSTIDVIVHAAGVVVIRHLSRLFIVSSACCYCFRCSFESLFISVFLFSLSVDIPMRLL